MLMTARAATVWAETSIKHPPFPASSTQSSQLASTDKVCIMGKFTPFLLVRTLAMLVTVTQRSNWQSGGKTDKIGRIVFPKNCNNHSSFSHTFNNSAEVTLFWPSNEASASSTRNINIAVNEFSGFATPTQKWLFAAILISRSRGTYLLHCLHRDHSYILKDVKVQ